MKLDIQSLFTVKKLTWFLVLLSLICLLASVYTFNRIKQINEFNQAVSMGKTPKTDKQSFEAKFATALYLAKKNVIKKPLCYLAKRCEARMHRKNQRLITTLATSSFYAD